MALLDILKSPIESASNALFGGVAKIIGQFKADPTKVVEMEEELAKLKIQHEETMLNIVAKADESQNAVNLQEAQSAKLFVSGWRPFIGWVCGSGLAIQFIISPICTWIASLANHPIVFPPLETGTMIELLFGMLGLGAMRTYEKLNNVAAK